ncbi:TPA: antitoxin of toxin-antitoxin stability system [Escherichia coli]|nr:antitoxin of toxin-antitoxin stability system [Escherichia coli]
MANTMFTMKLDTELRDEFMAEAAAADRPAAQIMRDFMRDFIKKQKDEREYKEFLQRKVEKARTSMEAGLGKSCEEVEATFAEKRAVLSRSMGITE